MLGNIYVAGLIELNRLFVIKFGPDGRQIWASQRQTGFGASQIFIDSAGAVTTWSADDIPRLAWPTDPDPLLALPAGGIARLDPLGNFLSTYPLGDGHPTTFTARVINGTNLFMSGWSRPNYFASYSLDLSSGSFRTQQVWNPATAPVLSRTTVRKTPPDSIHCG